MMRTDYPNLMSQVRLYMNGEMSESEQDLFFFDLDRDPALRKAAWGLFCHMKGAAA